jgi:hypothetical protein
MRLGAILLGSLYVLALLAATPLAYIGIDWLGVSSRGWRTQVAAGALLVGWLALALGAVFVWKFLEARRWRNLLLGTVSGLVAVAAYAVPFEWGGSMML